MTTAASQPSSQAPVEHLRGRTRCAGRSRRRPRPPSPRGTRRSQSCPPWRSEIEARIESPITSTRLPSTSRPTGWTASRTGRRARWSSRPSSSVVRRRSSTAGGRGRRVGRRLASSSSVRAAHRAGRRRGRPSPPVGRAASPEPHAARHERAAAPARTRWRRRIRPIEPPAACARRSGLGSAAGAAAARRGSR